MKHEEYMQLRNELLDAAQVALENSDAETYEAKCNEVKDLDSKWDVMAQRAAEINALKGAAKVPAKVAPQSAAVSFGLDDSDMEYRKAFMNYVMRGVALKNNDETTVASNVGAVIPNTILNRIVELMEANGNILARVTKTHFKGGATVPTSTAKPTATWVAERGDVDTFAKTTGSVTFSYYKLKVKVAISIVVDNVTLEIFERTLAANIAEAMTRALEAAVISGAGSASNQPTGILSATVPDGQTIAVTGAITYANLLAMEAALPTAYEAGAVYVMHKKIFFNNILSMVDSDGEPIARVSAGIDGKPAYRILGREVVLTDHMPYSITSTAATRILLLDLSNYMINTNLDVTVSTYTDEDTDDKITKAIMLADGKLIDNNGLVVMTLKNS